MGILRLSLQYQANIVPMIRTAWAENPTLAVQMSIRYQTPSSTNEVRRLVLEYPHLAMSDSEALHLLLKDRLSKDFGDRHLKVHLSFYQFTLS